ncbi:MAG: hypothetical protein KKA76_17075 [Proteobacteria bacterium]|nr:hypothetical protein [Pseudomonadota bacterium]
MFRFVPKGKMKDVTIMLKAIPASEDLQAAQEKAAAVAVRLRHIAGTKWSSKRYLNMQLLRELEVEKQFEVA